MTVRGLTPADRWRMKTIVMGPDECWPWIGAVTGKRNKKYGKMFICRENGRTITEYAHRFSWQLHFGPIEPGMEVDHTCNNGLCQNPAHFEEVTQGENKRREGARQTRCVHGHTYTVTNTYIDGDGHRRCRTCAEVRRAA